MSALFRISSHYSTNEVPAANNYASSVCWVLLVGFKHARALRPALWQNATLCMRRLNIWLHGSNASVCLQQVKKEKEKKEEKRFWFFEHPLQTSDCIKQAFATGWPWPPQPFKLILWGSASLEVSQSHSETTRSFPLHSKFFVCFLKLRDTNR